jgi:hypothetical protein
MYAQACIFINPLVPKHTCAALQGADSLSECYSICVGQIWLLLYSPVGVFSYHFFASVAQSVSLFCVGVWGRGGCRGAVRVTKIESCCLNLQFCRVHQDFDSSTKGFCLKQLVL